MSRSLTPAGFAAGLVVALAALSVVIAQQTSGVLATSPDQKVFAVGAGAILRLLDAKTEKVLVEVRAHTGTVTAAAFSPDGRFLASGGEDKSVRIWQPASGKELRTLKGHAAAIRKLAFSEDGKTLTSTDSDQKSRVWDVATGKVLQ